jgi:hypothetical protein
MNPPPRPTDDTRASTEYVYSRSAPSRGWPHRADHPIGPTDSLNAGPNEASIVDPNAIPNRPAANTQPSPSDPLTAFFDQREQRSRASIRTPLVLGAHRIALAADRIGQLEELLQHTRLDLLNLNPRADPGRASSLEDRAIRLATELHAERLSVWKDLQPLAEKITDASLDAMRRTWLELLASSDGQPPGPPAPHPSMDAEHPGGGSP